LPFFTTIIDKISPDYSPVLNIAMHEQAYSIDLLANITRPIRLSGEKFLPPGTLLTAGSHVIHTMVPMVILFTVLIAWPVKRIKERVIVLLLGLPMVYIVLGLTTPQLLAGRIAIKIFEYKAREGIVPPEPFIIQWMIFVESGGRWLLPLAGAISCVGFMGFINRWMSEFSETGIRHKSSQPKKTKQQKKQEKKARTRRKSTMLENAAETRP
jgi:hypothetical protein